MPTSHMKAVCPRSTATSAVATCVCVPSTAVTRPARCQPSACFSDVASAWISTRAPSYWPVSFFSSASAHRKGHSAFSPMKVRPSTVNTSRRNPFFSTMRCSRPGFTVGRLAGRHTRSRATISVSKPFWSHTWSPSVRASTPPSSSVWAMLAVMPEPAAAFSPLAMTKSIPRSALSFATSAPTISRPGLPTMSPMKRNFMSVNCHREAVTAGRGEPDGLLRRYAPRNDWHAHCAR